MFLLSKYTAVTGSWADRQEAYKALGVGTRCRSHAARMVKSTPGAWFLKCRLRSCTPPCEWSGVLVSTGGSAVELRTVPEQCHNDASPETGKRGLPSLEVQQHVQALYTALPEARPRAVLDSVRKEFGPVALSLRAVQERKQSRRRGTSLGELASAVSLHTRVPPMTSLHQAFFVQREVMRIHGKPWVTLVATTHNLLQQFADTGGE